MSQPRVLSVWVCCLWVGCTGRALDIPEALGRARAADGDGGGTVDELPTPAPDLARIAVSQTDLAEPVAPQSHDDPAWAADACGNGRLDDGEDCDEGPRTGWSDLWIAQVGLPTTTIAMRRGTQPGVVFYDYSNGSSQIGDEVAREGRIFLYHGREDGQIVLVLSFGGDGQPAAYVQLKLDISFNADVLLCDALPGDLCETYSFRRFARAHWSFGDSTAGAVVGGLEEGDSMHVLIYPEQLQGIDRLVYVDGDGTKIEIDPTAGFSIRGEPSPTCRPDCTRP